ncbi:unnamed protein product [Leptosia nina]|uniref:Uncharacterized protein n=1 Tax=Leptosia nina TaxID=320188 RepID=A0AAV1JXG3_9NEOP
MSCPKPVPNDSGCHWREVPLGRVERKVSCVVNFFREPRNGGAVYAVTCSPGDGAKHTDASNWLSVLAEAFSTSRAPLCE